MARKWLFAAAFIGLAAVAGSTTYCGRALLEARDRDYPHVRYEDCPRADAIAVLSGDGAPRMRQLMPWEPPNRSEAGLRLCLSGRAPNLIFTDGGPEGDASREFAMLAGISPERITVVRPARNTEDEARFIAELARERGWHRLILVTSGYHMARAKLFVEHAARVAGAQLKVYPFAADSAKFFIRHKGIVDFLPGRGVEQTARTIREELGVLSCRVGVC